MNQYLPIFTMLVLAILFSGLSFFASGLLAPCLLYTSPSPRDS